jgi:hypothetical protein
MSVLFDLSKSQGFNVIVSFACGPVPGSYVLKVTVSTQGFRLSVPTAVPLVDERAKSELRLLKAKVAGMFAKAGCKTTPLVNVKERLFRSLAVAGWISSEHPSKAAAPTMATIITRPGMV